MPLTVKPSDLLGTAAGAAGRAAATIEATRTNTRNPYTTRRSLGPVDALQLAAADLIAALAETALAAQAIRMGAPHAFDDDALQAELAFITSELRVVLHRQTGLPFVD